MESKGLPTPNGTRAFWQSDPSELENFRSTEKLPSSCDLVVIGGGYSAAALVTHILEQYPESSSILVLEARQLCSGATGRNGGHLKPDLYVAPSKLAGTHGPAAGEELAEFEAANVQAVKEFVQKEKIDCDLCITRGCDVYFTRAQSQKAAKGMKELQNAGVKAAQDVWETEEKHAETVSGVKGAKGCFTFTAGHIWPYKLIHHLFRRAIDRGVNLQTNTPVDKIYNDGKAHWTIATYRGSVKTKKVVMATNAYTHALLPEYKDQIIPYRAISCRIVTPDGTHSPLLTNTYSLRFKDWDFDYLIPRPDGSIIVGGARSAYFAQKNLWYGNSDDSAVIEEARHYFDGYMQRFFLGWENSGAFVDDIWTGIMGYSRDKLPRLGPIPGRPGMFIMGGWTGHGMPQIFLAAKAMAAIVIADVPYCETGLPRIFEESESRLKSSPNEVLDSWVAAVKQSRL